MADPVTPYNGTGMIGGDPMLVNVNMWYDAGDISWMITSTALVLLMIPGVGFFYSGLARRKSALSLIWLSVMATAVTSFQWFFWGYSLTFSHTAGLFYGDLENIGFRNVLAAPSVGSPKIPDLLFAVYQGMFAAITVALAVGAVAERGRMLPCVIFMFVWSTLIYDPIACWTWNTSGWVNKMGGLDFAGGTPVHISSGAAALAYSFMLGPRRGLTEKSTEFQNHSTSSVVIGTVFLWVGWFGFNAGSANAANLRAVMAAVVTNLAACVGGITWCLIDYYYERKWSTIGFCSGVVTGLVAITPGSGYVPAWSAIVFGVVGSIAANYGTKIKGILRIDDSLDIFAVHAIGGLAGNILTGIFASDSIVHLDGFSHIRGGWIDGNWIQVPIQLCDSVTGGLYSFVGTVIILYFINCIPGCALRCSEFSEYIGVDDGEIGEFTYDYIGITRNVGDKTDARDLIVHYEECRMSKIDLFNRENALRMQNEKISARSATSPVGSYLAPEGFSKGFSQKCLSDGPSDDSQFSRGRSPTPSEGQVRERSPTPRESMNPGGDSSGYYETSGVSYTSNMV